MTTLSLPSWFDVAECEMQLVPEVRGFSGPFGGPTEVQDLIGDRWRMRLTLPDGDFNHGGRTEALFNRLRGGADWLRLHHLAKPVPRGTARGDMTLASTLAQGGNVLTVSGARGVNALLGGSFEVDSNADGVADLWSLYTLGATGTVTPGLSAATVAHGTKAQRITASGLGTTTGDLAGVYHTAPCAHLAGLPVTFRASVAVFDGSPRAMLYLTWRNGGVVLQNDALSITPTATLQGYSLSATAPVGATEVDAFLWMHSRASGAGLAVCDFDAAQLVAGTGGPEYPLPASLLAGDMLGHNGEQLFQVFEDTAATDAGRITVSAVNRARKAIASGQPIVWDRPSLPFQLLDTSGVPTAYTRGRARGQQVEFVEAWT
jgi:hypothetical protein